MPQLEKDTYFAGRYRLIKKLGSGGFSVVWLADDTMAGDAKIAIKIYAPDKGLDKDGIDNFRKEYAITLDLNHSSLLSSKHFDVNDGSPYLIMQYMSSGSALKLIENIDEQRLGKFIYQVSSGLAYLHSNEPAIVHQDIKPDNVLISSKDDFLLTDFGISTRVRRTLTKSVGNVGYSGTIAYVPPERYMRNPKPQPAGDIFAFGVMLFEMMTGYLPWNEQGGLGFVSTQIIPPIDAPGFSHELKDLSVACMSFEHEQRPLASEISLYAQHFVQNGIWDERYMPLSIRIVAESTKKQAEERIAEALKKETLETERKNALEKERLAKEESDKIKEEQERKAQEEENKKKEAAEKIQAQFQDSLQKAQRLLEQKKPKEAIEAFQACLAIKEDDFVKKQISLCEEIIKESLKIKEQEDKEKYLSNLQSKAHEAFTQGKLKQAKNFYNKTLSQNANNAEAKLRIEEINSLQTIKKIESRRKLIKIVIPLILLLSIGAAAFWFINLPTLPTAQFSLNKAHIKAGESIQFTSNSENTKQLNWYFEGGEPEYSSEKDPLITYANSGQFAVKLLVSNQDGKDSKLKPALITVSEKEVQATIPLPTADFSVNKTTVITGKSVQFTSKSKEADRLEWEFENGSPATSSKKNPSVKYSKSGSFKVSLTAYNASGKKTKTKKKYILASKEIKKPIAKMETDTSFIYVGGQIEFRDISSFNSSREWLFEGGEPLDSKEKTQIVTYAQVGNYKVELEVSNKKGKDQLVLSDYIIVTENPQIILQREFTAHLETADAFFHKEKFDKAMKEYQLAKEINSNDTYVLAQIKKINAKKNQQGAYMELIVGR
ncbi:MAG: hypothetical protein B7C24_06660 [Bacteroidetes bacterium 4572_77]|nr:MAG: hypothetical protein B7C24_06660 [Bacteroidetes bacterium 4572_77]